MAVQKIFTLEDLKELGLPIIGSYQFSDTKVGEYYLQAKVISMWDWKDYSDFYTYFEDSESLGGEAKSYKNVVMLMHKTDEKTTKFEPLKKDFSNAPNLANETDEQ